MRKKQPDPLRRYLRQAIRDDYTGDEFRAARVRRLGPIIPFAERLVHFWANHFTVSVVKLRARPRRPV